MARKIAIVVVLLVAVVIVIARKQSGRSVGTATSRPGQASSGHAPSQPTPALPRLVDLGRGKCIPCKKMMPILAELKAEYAGRLQVDVIDIGEDAEAAERYKINLIPTQIFFDAAGKELFRHEGYIPKADILAKWKEFGVDLGSPSSRPSAG